MIGPISSVTILGQTIVIVNDVQTAVELLEKRSAKHSSRPKQIFAGEMYVSRAMQTETGSNLCAQARMGELTWPIALQQAIPYLPQEYEQDHWF